MFFPIEYDANDRKNNNDNGYIGCDVLPKMPPAFWTQWVSGDSKSSGADHQNEWSTKDEDSFDHKKAI